MIIVFKTYLRLKRKNTTKRYSLNLNTYRNLHFYTKNKLKQMFTKSIINDISCSKYKKISLHYTIYSKTKRRFDIMNIGSICDKFFSDTLVEAGVIEDDNYTIIPKVLFEYGGKAEDDICKVEIREII